MNRRPSHPDRFPQGLRQVPMIVWLWLLWILLWGSTSAVVLIGGLLVAVGVVLLFPLPAVLPGSVPRPLQTGRLLVDLFTNLVKSGCTVAWQVVRHGRRTPSAIVEVPLCVDSDLLIAAVARLTTMTPGTVVVEIDRRRRRLYVHALPVRDQRDIARRRSDVQAVERRVVRAAGHHRGAEKRGPAPTRPDDTRRQSRGREP
ncbi:Na+/H+ antiporter subunit E [Streptomyces albogriseolus]|uniref:Na+/H+ antiporter subunit E n=1 Tax=Streptomyces TaxID=1883 RepID=UPI002100526A|nr:Na+/H+ antiporter subunit E [Streptomyces sp. F-7]